MMLTEEEKRELKDLAKSFSLRQDCERLLKSRHNPFIVNGKVDMDCFLTFLNEYNYFISHTPRPFRRIADKDFRL